MNNKLINKILKSLGYVRKDIVIKKLKEQKSELISLEEQIFELKCERQQLLMEVEYRRKENQLLAASLEDQKLEKIAAEKSLLIAKEVMKKDRALKKVFGGEN